MLNFQKHLELVNREMPFQYIDMHGLFHEEMTIIHEVSDRNILERRKVSYLGNLIRYQLLIKNGGDICSETRLSNTIVRNAGKKVTCEFSDVDWRI